MKKLTDPKVLTIAAMLTAIGIVLGLFKWPINPFLEIRFGSLPISIAGYLFGPGIGAVVGALCDIGGYIVRPTGPFFPGFTISGIISGIIFGLVLYRHKPTFLRILAAFMINAVVVGIFINSLWLTFLYKLEAGYWATLVARIPKELILAVICTVIIFALTKALSRVLPTESTDK